jgi:hypothetical protein
MAAQGSSFKVRQFNPEVDRLEIACLRESNFPTLIDGEASSTTIDGSAALMLWNQNADTLMSIDFGNGYWPTLQALSIRPASLDSVCSASCVPVTTPFSS